MTVILLYLVAFAIATRMFLHGFHTDAYLLMIGSFLLCLGVVLRRDRRQA
jgi:hypothetical protein